MYNNLNRIWLGGSMPANYRAYGHRWQELNPEHSVVDWHDDDVFGRKWINQYAIDTLTEHSKSPGANMSAYYTYVADFVCYEILYEQGGWYFNTDLCPVKSLSNLSFDREKPAFAFEDDVHIINMAMYSPPKHPFMKDVIEEIGSRFRRSPSGPMNTISGAGALLDVANRSGWDKISTFDRIVFNPIHFTSVPIGTEPEWSSDELSEETVAVHLWGHRKNGRGNTIL